MGSALAKQLRAPVTGSCMGWMAQRIMSMGNGADSIDAVSQLVAASGNNVVENPVIVEIGPGSGYAMKTMLSTLSPSRMYGIEISDAFRNQLLSDTELAPFHASDVLSLHGDDAKNLFFILNNSVDIIFAFNVIYFLNPLSVYLKECYRILKPGGCVMFSVKGVAQKMDPSVYINTDWDKCLQEMKTAGFVEVEAKEERLEDSLSYIPLYGKKPN
mmetsp:Transcript_786/g.1205  ORF Transcript_786/g.1205 Transcript_786/m.1205 type:complete len:215 (-) Transcript_786:248-892(-)